MVRSWILVGMMGSGKSSVGRAVAELTGREFVDTDQLVQHRVARPIRQFFAIYGEDAFRELETATLREMKPSHAVVATGGGIILRDENWAEIKRLGESFYLRAAPDTLKGRLAISRSRRPLLQFEDWEQKLEIILETRVHLYEQADHCIDVDALPIEEVARQVVERAEEGLNQ